MYQAPRGTSDILPEQQPYWSYVGSQVEQTMRTFGYQRIDTPVFESTGLFVHTVGEETDIVQKEMYSFLDRGEQQLTLRPEGTAAVSRAYLEHGMHNQPQPVRLYYFSPMFRYDRPQAGRYRQFHQFGAEAMGDADVAVDVEMLQLALVAIQSLGLGQTTLVPQLHRRLRRPARLSNGPARLLRTPLSEAVRRLPAALRAQRAPPPGLQAGLLSALLG